MIQNGKFTPASIEEYDAIGMLLNTDESVQVDTIGCATAFNTFSRMQVMLSANYKKWGLFCQKKSKLTPEDIDRVISGLLQGGRKTALLLIVGFNYVDFCFNDGIDVIWIGPKGIAPKSKPHKNQYVIDVRTPIHSFDDVEAISMCEDRKDPAELDVGIDVLRPVRMLCEEFSNRGIPATIPRAVFLTIILQTLAKPVHMKVYEISCAALTRVIYSIVTSYNLRCYTDIYADIYCREQMIIEGFRSKNIDIEVLLPIIPEILLKLYGWEFTRTLYRNIVSFLAEPTSISQTFRNPQQDSVEMRIDATVDETANLILRRTVVAAAPTIREMERRAEIISCYIHRCGFFSNPFSDQDIPSFIENIILIPWHEDFPHIVSNMLLKKQHRLDAVYCLGQTETGHSYAHFVYRTMSINNDGIAEYKTAYSVISLSPEQYLHLANDAEQMIRALFVQ